MKNLSKFIATALIGMTLFAAPVMAQEENACYTPEYTAEYMQGTAAELGETVTLVHTETFPDGSIAQFWWKGGETVLALTYTSEGCADIAQVITLAQFRELTGIVLAAT